MLEPFNKRKLAVSVSLRYEVSPFSKRKMLQIDAETVENILSFSMKFFVVFNEISVKFPKDFVKRSNTINNERTSYSLNFLKRTLQRFASKTFQNDDNYLGKFQHLRFCGTYI